MAITEKRKDSMMEYAKKNLKRVPLDVQKEHYERIKAHAEGRGETVNGFIKRAVDSQMERDGVYGPQEATGQPAGPGVVSFDTLETAQRAAEATGETVGEFLSRAVETQAQRDKSSLRMGLNPATGDKLEREA